MGILGLPITLLSVDIEMAILFFTASPGVRCYNLSGVCTHTVQDHAVYATGMHGNIKQNVCTFKRNVAT